MQIETKEQLNRLARETSPYLLQHARNPVNWYPWGEEAFEKARRENKPVFLSIGYSACHWCHVMERESFENKITAAILNRDFVAVKVDREEHPEVDSIYMNAVQMMTGSGGWPLSVFLTPDLKPFFGGTYFPPDDRFGTPSFNAVLLSVAKAWKERRSDVQTGAEEIAKALRSISEQPQPRSGIATGAVDAAVRELADSFDRKWGGFGFAPKFPPSGQIALLLRHHARTGDGASLDMACATLDGMARGGMCDQLGGGFHRYSVDEKWLIPHFEKMLYDNALLARVYLEAFELTSTPKYRRVAVDTLDYVIREMTDGRGGFYASQDADSEGVEGKYYIWTPEEIEKAVGSEDAEMAAEYYGVTRKGNFEGGSVLSVAKDSRQPEIGENSRLDQSGDSPIAWRAKLLKARHGRTPPGKDTKIIAAWNGLMISAFAVAYRTLGEERFKTAAENAAGFVLSSMMSGGELVASHAGGAPGGPAGLDDYANMANGLIDLYEATFDSRWLESAEKLTRKMTELFADPNGNGLYSTSAAHGNLLVRTKTYADSFIPPGNAVAALALSKLARLMEKPQYSAMAEQIMSAAGHGVMEQPSAFPSMLIAADFARPPRLDIAVVGKAGSNDAKQMLAAVNRAFLPNAVVVFADPSGDGYAVAVERIPLLRDRPMAKDGQATAYVCENAACKAPVTKPEELTRLLAGYSQRKPKSR